MLYDNTYNEVSNPIRIKAVGFDKKDIDVTVSKDFLVVKSKEQNVFGESLYYSIKVPNIDSSTVKPKLNNGILEIEYDLVKKAKPKHIQIE